MAYETIPTSETAGELFLCPPGMKLAEIVEEALKLGKEYPETLEAIEKDLHDQAKRKKLERLKDRAWQASRTMLLEGMEDEVAQELRVGDVNLGVGRPRLPTEVVLVFLQVRGYLGSVTNQKAAERIADSMTLRGYVTSKGLRFPAVRTILDNLNGVSNATRELILDKQLLSIRQEGLDDFSMALIDSTSVEGNSEWPTDSELLYKLVGRAFRSGLQLKAFGVPPFRSWSLPRWLRELDRLGFEINATAGKSGGKRKRRTCYRRLYRIVEKALARLRQEQHRARQSVESIDLPPSIRARLQRVWTGIEEDLTASERVLDYSCRRVVHEQKIPSAEKVLSVSDPSVAMIVKGGRETVLGYKPQIVRSEHGFATALIIEEGNISDSASLLPAIRQHKERTGVTPHSLSADDGYASKAGRDALLKMKVKNVSFSGSKGRRVMPEEDWDDDVFAALRGKRSAVESIIFILKYAFEFDHMRRRGIDAVRAEMLEKILAHNFWRMSFIRRQRRRRAG